MAKKETKEVSTQLSAEQLAILDSSYPVEDSFSSVMLPRLGMYSQDKMEGKGKDKKVTAEAGIFYTERQTEKLDANGKKVWEKSELDTEIEAIILYERKQLSFYDGEKYTSSPIYDNDSQAIPLFRDRKEIDRGTPAELKGREEYQGKSAKGKDISKLEDIKVLYVLLDGDVYQMNLRGTSMYAFKTYKKSFQPNRFLTRMNSESKINGKIEWNQMTFEAVRPINSDEGDTVIAHIADIKKAVEAQAAFYAGRSASSSKAVAKKPSEDDDDF